MPPSDRPNPLDLPPPTRALMAEIEACRVRNEKAIAAPTPWLEDHPGVQAAIDAVLCANRMEGVTLDKRRTHQLAVGPAPLPQGDAERRLWNYRQAWRWVHRVGADAQISPDDLRTLHGYAHDRFPGDGRWRSAEAGSQAAELCARYHGALKAGIWALPAAAALTHDFKDLQPFAAANDRIAMLLAQLALYKAGVGVFRFVSLERLIEESPQGWRARRPSPAAWVHTFMTLVRRAYQGFEEASARPAPRPAPKKPAPPRSKPAPAPRKPAPSAPRTMTAALKAFIDAAPGRFTLADLRRACPVAKQDLIVKVLKRLKKDGVIRPIGRGKHAAWEKVRSARPFTN